MVNKKKDCKDNKSVVAATAGLDTWKTWAGRSKGDDDFEILDLYRGMKRKLKKKFIWQLPPKGSNCPICFCEAESWFMTSSCGHCVCIDCFRAYAYNQVLDAEQMAGTPLKCPVCSMPLRPNDAIAALEDNDEIIMKWDIKLRDHLLRTLPNYRQCPHCCSTNTNQQQSSSASTERRTTNTIEAAEEDNNSITAKKTRIGNGGVSGGGGFVSSECLQPIHEGRERDANRWIKSTSGLDQGLSLIYLCYISYYYFYINSSSTWIDIYNMILLPILIICRIHLLYEAKVASVVRELLFRAIEVECPCCDSPFVLNAESEWAEWEQGENNKCNSKNSAAEEQATRDWIGSNTRSCPSCSARIIKIDGCNHMKCAHCKVKFCWACMRLRTNCGAYKCTNGAPYGNAQYNNSDSDQIYVQGQEGFGDVDTSYSNNSSSDNEINIMEHIRRIENRATQLQLTDIVAVFVMLIKVSGRNTHVVESVLKFTSLSINIGFSVISITSWALIMCWAIHKIITNFGYNLVKRLSFQQQQQHPSVMQFQFMRLLGLRHCDGRILRERMIDNSNHIQDVLTQEAITRSLIEQ